ncbi:MAG TPA: hypothetical protein PLO56_16590 [Rhodothermales bacterium]|nr:hypothetical protein [Rhodothermales bacterium]
MKNSMYSWALLSFWLFSLTACDLVIVRESLRLPPLAKLDHTWKVVSGSLVIKSVGDQQVMDLVGILTPDGVENLNTDPTPKAYTLQMEKGLSKPLSIDWKKVRAYYHYDVQRKLALGAVVFVNLETMQVIHFNVERKELKKSEKQHLFALLGLSNNQQRRAVIYEGDGLAEYQGLMVSEALKLSKTETALFSQFTPCITWSADKAQREPYCGSSATDPDRVPCLAGGEGAVSCGYGTAGSNCTIACGDGLNACCGAKTGSATVGCKCCEVKDTNNPPNGSMRKY